MAGSKFDGALGKLGAIKKVIAPEAAAVRVGPGRPKGKRSNPDFERLTVLVSKATRKTAERRWEDEQPSRDMSDLVESLLERYASGQL